MNDLEAEIEHTYKHGQVMYALALKHAIAMIEIDPNLGLAKLKKQLADCEAVKEGYSELL